MSFSEAEYTIHDTFKSEHESFVELGRLQQQQHAYEFEPELAAHDHAAAQAAAAGSGLSEEEARAESERRSRLLKKSPFRTMLLSKCQVDFEASLQPAEREGREDDEADHEADRKRKKRGLVKFIGEL